MSKYKNISGFTLIEMSIVVLILATLITAAVSIAGIFIDRNNLEITRERSQLIQQALISYSKIHGTLPCPAAFDTDPDDATFGAALDCTNSAAQGGSIEVDGIELDPAPPFDPEKVRTGAVPIRNLNLEVDAALDGFGNKFVYAVTVNQVLEGYDPSRGGIIVQDPNGNDVLEPGAAGGAVYVLYSPGQNRKNGFNLDGVRVGADCPVVPVTEEDQNCDFDASFVYSAQLSLGNNAAYYDDVFHFATVLPDVKPVVCNAENEGIQRYYRGPNAKLYEYCDGSVWLPISPPIYRVDNPEDPPAGPGRDAYSLNQQKHQAFCDPQTDPTKPRDRAISGSGNCPHCDAAGDPVCGKKTTDITSQKITSGAAEGWEFVCKVEQPNPATAVIDTVQTRVWCEDYPPYHGP